MSDIAERKIKVIAKKIKKDTAKCLTNKGLFYREKDENRLQKAINNYSNIGNHYTVSKDCIGCGLCEKVCPVKNITIHEQKPVFGDNCQQCMACIQWCPKRAIDYKDIAGKRKLYHHRDVAIKDIIQGNKI